MSVSKRSVSLDPDVAEAVEEAAAEDGVSFSLWLSEAARHRLRIRNGLRGVAEWEADAGPLSREEIAAGEALLDRLLSGQHTSQRSA
ncbi:MAG: hypothetical protein ACRD0K_15770 [Egibacteraceae bacterium]